MTSVPALSQPAEPQAVVEQSFRSALPDVLEEITPAVVNIAVTSATSSETNP
ncbi:MAG: serine endoprotease DegQ, partial [Mesorhizobium sp.]